MTPLCLATFWAMSACSERYTMIPTCPFPSTTLSHGNRGVIARQLPRAAGSRALWSEGSVSVSPAGARLGGLPGELPAQLVTVLALGRCGLRVIH
jgi:hypothetical protein